MTYRLPMIQSHRYRHLVLFQAFPHLELVQNMCICDSLSLSPPEHGEKHGSRLHLLATGSAYFSPCRTSSPARFYSSPTARGYSPPACLEPSPSEAASRSEETSAKGRNEDQKGGRFPQRVAPAVHLAGLHGRGDVGRLRREPRGAQQVADSVHIPLVLLHRLHLHLLLWQQGLVTRRVARWRQELEVAVPAAQQEANPDGIKRDQTGVESIILLIHPGGGKCGN